MDLAWLIDST